MSMSDGWWTKSGIVCPNCKGTNTEINIMEVLLSMPEQYKYRCKCGHHWTSTEYHLTPSYENITPIVKKQNGSYGWICPVCGAGVSPYQDHCPCCSGKSLTPTWISGKNIGVYSPDTNITVNTTMTRNHIDGTLTATFEKVSEDNNGNK